MAKVMISLYDYCIANEKEDLLTEWDDEKNGDITPKNVSWASKGKAFWICKKNHSYYSNIYHRTKGVGCPYCDGKKPIVGENDLATKYPEIAKEWDYDKNYPDRPEEFTCASNKKKWWICSKCSFEWESVISGRTSKGYGCPMCARKKLSEDKKRYHLEKSGVITDEKLIREWDYEKNYPYRPEDFTPGDDKKVGWICSLGHKWDARINGRTKKGYGCPYCTNRKILIGFNDLKTTHPKLAEEWAIEKNREELNLEVTGVTFGSSKKAYWICKKHGLYQQIIAHRVKGVGCPYCGRKIVFEGETDLATVAPEIAKEWDTDKNGCGPEKVFAYSQKKCHWKCKLGHEWVVDPNSRVSQNSGCPYCAHKRVIVGENDLETLYPEIAKEWNYEKNGLLKPSDVYAKSKESVWWTCPLGHDYRSRIVSRTVKHSGCSICYREFETSFQEQAIFYYLKKIFPNTICKAQFDWLGVKEIDIFIPDINVGIEYDGGYWHDNIERDKKKDDLCIEHGIDLIRIRDKVAKNYDTNVKIIIIDRFSNSDDIRDTIIEVIKYINQKYNYNKTIDIDIDRDSIDINDSFIFNEKTNSLESLRPDIAKEWDYEKNGKITPKMVSVRTKKKFFWLCSKYGHSFKTSVCERTGGKGHNTKCPICTGNKVLQGFNDLEFLYPELMKEWDYEKNAFLPSTVTSGSNKSAYWKCKNGHQWYAVICNRTKLKSGCPICSKKKKK